MLGSSQDELALQTVIDLSQWVRMWGRMHLVREVAAVEAGGLVGRGGLDFERDRVALFGRADRLVVQLHAGNASQPEAALAWHAQGRPHLCAIRILLNVFRATCVAIGCQISSSFLIALYESTKG